MHKNFPTGINPVSVIIYIFYILIIYQTYVFWASFQVYVDDTVIYLSGKTISSYKNVAAFTQHCLIIFFVIQSG